MNILFLVDNYPDSQNPVSNIFVHNQVKALLKAGVCVDVLYLDFRSPRRIRRLGMSTYTFDQTVIYRYSLPCGSAKLIHYLLFSSFSSHIYKIFKKINLCEYDIIHAHFTRMGIAAADIKEKFGIPYVLTEHSSALLDSYIHEMTKQECLSAYNHSDYLIAVGNNLKNAMEQFTNVPIRVIPNILRDGFFWKPTKKYESFSFITVVGNLTKDKRIDLLVEAFIELEKIYHNMQLKIYGTGKRMRHLQDQIKNSCQNSNIEFCGIVPNDQLPEHFRKCHCFVLPSVKETFGMVYAEAMACGLPSIAAKSGGPEDFINQENGLLIQKDSLKELYDAMEFIYLNYKIYSPVRISELIIQNLGESVYLKKILEVYKQLGKRL